MNIYLGIGDLRSVPGVAHRVDHGRLLARGGRAVAVHRVAEVKEPVVLEQVLVVSVSAGPGSRLPNVVIVNACQLNITSLH